MVGAIVLLAHQIDILGDAMVGEPPNTSYVLLAIAVDQESQQVVDHLTDWFEMLEKPFTDKEEFADFRKAVNTYLDSWRCVTVTLAERRTDI